MAEAASTDGLRRTADRLRLPPHSLEAEQSLLGGLMLDQRAWDQVADLVSVDDLYRADHRLIFGAIAALAERNQPPDAVTVSERLQQLGQLEAAGGLQYLARLVEDVPSAANIRAYAQIVRDRAMLRQLIEIGGDIAASAHTTEGLTVAEIVDLAEQRVFEIADRGQRRGSGFVQLKQILPRTIDRLDVLSHSTSDITGISTGFTDLDKLTAGLQRGELIIIAGRPSMGKTTLAMNLAENAAIGGQVPTAIFSMEMSAEQLSFRMIGSIGRVNQTRLRTGKLTDEDWSRIDSAVSMMSSAPIFIDDSGALTPTEVRARARRLKREHGLGLIVVDYLQLMQVTGTVENRATEISEISRSLKALSKELDVPVIALSQLNRSVEQRTDKKPVMSDLRECVAGETLVCLADGRRKRVSELVGTTPTVWALDRDRRIVEARADEVWCVGRRPVKRVLLESGLSIRATADHRLLARRGWTSVGGLGANDRLAVAKALPRQPIRLARRFASEVRGFATRLMTVGSTVWNGKTVFSMRGTSGAVDPAGLFGCDVAMEDIGASNVSWDRVIDVVPDGEAEVFDLTVPGPANWLADGIVTHNSGAIEQDADLIVFIYREEVYEPDTPRKGIADIIIAKQRNGPVGEVRLTFLGEFTKFENLIAEAYGEGVF